MSMKAVGRYVFRFLVLLPVGYLVFWLLSLTPVFDFSWLVVVGGTFFGAWFHPRASFAWGHILDNYEKHVPGLSMLITQVGYFKDKHEINDEGIPVFTSVAEEGLILYRGHLVPLFRETAVIPWHCIKSKKLVDKTPVSQDGIVDQNSVMFAELRVQGLAVPIELPWSKEIELYSNILEERSQNMTANRSKHSDGVDSAGV